MASEADIERALTQECKRLHLILLKLWPFNMVGIPDRLVLAPGGRVLFLELKTEQGKLAPRQKYWQRRLTRYGFQYTCTSGLRETLETVQEFVK